jgi:hypothetical protein
VALRRDQLPLAQQLIEQALALRREAHDSAGVLDAEISLANVLLERGPARRGSDGDRRAVRCDQPAAEQGARAAAVRARILREQGRAAEGRKILAAARQLSTEGFSAATAVALDLEDGRLLAALGDASTAARRVRDVATREKMHGLLAFELEAELVRWTIERADRAAVMDLVRRARTAKFNLIARKAEMILGGPVSSF